MGNTPHQHDNDPKRDQRPDQGQQPGRDGNQPQNAPPEKSPGSPDDKSRETEKRDAPR